MTAPDVSLEHILTEEGYITMNGDIPVYHYFLKDHLSNVRVVMNENGVTVRQSNSYYPFGGIFKNKGDGEHPFKFGGKEFDHMHGLNWPDFVARMKGHWRFMPIDHSIKVHITASSVKTINGQLIIESFFLGNTFESMLRTIDMGFEDTVGNTTLQHSFGSRKFEVIYIPPDSHPQRACQSFEDTFNLMMFVLPLCLDIQIHLCSITQ